jgi:pimeloyl-ACP methyl ester carboxylesterase
MALSISSNFLFKSLCVAGILSLAFFAHGKSSVKAQRGEKAKKIQFVTSKDGTRIAYQRWGAGPALITVGGALSERSAGSELAQLLSPHFTVYSYDRRGRGDSSDTKPYSVQREIEDLEALIANAGGSAYVYGKSSGASLALQAAAMLGGKITKLALYEPPYSDADGAAKEWREFTKKIDGLLAEDRRDEAITQFMKFVGAPEGVIVKMKASPAWSGMLAMAPTLAYDNLVLGEDRAVPVEIAAKVRAETLVMDGGASLKQMPFMRPTADKLGKTIPNARRHILEGQAHDVSAKALAPILETFFK